MVRIIAKKQITIKHISAILTIKLKESRPDLVYLMRNLEELDITDGERLNLQLHLEYLNLLKDGTITTSGDRAIETGMAYIPESGFYDLFYIIQPELGLDAVIIHFERKTPNRKSMEEGNTTTFSEYKLFDRKKWTSWKDKELEFGVYFERSGDNPPVIICKKEIACGVTLDSNDYPSMQHTIKVNANEFKYEDKSYAKFDLSKNLPNLIHDWDQKIKVKRVSFEDVKDNPDLLRNFKTREHGMAKKLIFADNYDDDTWSIDIDHIDIVPKNHKNAELWLVTLLRFRLQEEQCHATLQYCEEIVKDIINNSPLNRSHPKLSLDGDKIFKIIKKFSDCDTMQDIQIAEDLFPSDSFLVNSPTTGELA